MTDTMLVERRLERWLSVSEPEEQIAAQVLATALNVSRTALADVIAAAYGSPPAIGERATSRLLGRPFVEHLEDGYRIAEPLASRLRQRFRESDPTAYRQVSDALVHAESENLVAAESEEDQWFAQGRIAFYLAAIDPDESANSFLRAFAHPPAGDPGPPRSWLAELVFKQQDQLAGQARTIAFFRAWKSYRDGRLQDARRAFETVIESHDLDAPRAISLHLWSVIAARDSRAESNLQEAIALSKDLGLLENEVMATNTLVYRLVALAEREKERSSAIHVAAALARNNLEQAEVSGDDYLRVWCLSALARTWWLDASYFGADAESVPPDAVARIHRLLDAAEDQAWRLGDLESVAEAVNTRASVERDRGEFGNAVSALERGLRRMQNMDPPRAAARWGQTAGSMRNRNSGKTVKVRLDALRRRLDRWLQRSI